MSGDRYTEGRQFILMRNALDRANASTTYRAYLNEGGNVWRIAIPFGKGWRSFSEGHVSDLKTATAFADYDYRTQRENNVKAFEAMVGDGSVLRLHCCSGRDDIERHYVAHALRFLQGLANQHASASYRANAKGENIQQRIRESVRVGPYLSDVSPVAYWYNSGYFLNDDEARGAFKLAKQQGLDGMGMSVREWMGLTEAEYDAWMKSEALPRKRPL